MPKVKDSPSEQPTEESQIPTTPQMQPKTNWPLIILGSFAGLIFLGVVIYVASSYGKGTQVTPIPTPIAQPTERPSLTITVTPTPDFAAGWKKYTNDEMSLSFRYPVEFSLQENSISAVSNLSQVIVSLSHNEILNYPQISLSAARTEASIQQWIKDQNDCPSTFDSCTPIVPGPVSGSVQFESINRHYGGIHTLIKKGDIIFDFSLGVKEPNQPPKQTESQLYNQILSTFKFTD